MKFVSNFPTYVTVLYGVADTALAANAISFLRGFKDHRQRTHLHHKSRFLKIFDLDLSEEAAITELATFRRHSHTDQCANEAFEVSGS